MNTYPAILSARLELAVLAPEIIRAILRDDDALAAKLLGSEKPAVWNGSASLLNLRLKEMTANPKLVPWLLRAMIHRETRKIIGHIGCHSAPNPQYLRDAGLVGVEYGYTVFEPHRRQGYAREAAVALMDWAHGEHGVEDFVLSIAPTNEPSLRLAKGLGFAFHSTFQDPEDGIEHIYTGKYPGAPNGPRTVAADRRGS